MTKKRQSLDLDFEEEKKKTFIDKLKEFVYPRQKVFQPRKSLSFNVGVAIILFFIYSLITLVSIVSFVYALLVLIPTLYILIRYIKLERENSAKL